MSLITLAIEIAASIGSLYIELFDKCNISQSGKDIATTLNLVNIDQIPAWVQDIAEGDPGQDLAIKVGKQICTDWLTEHAPHLLADQPSPRD